MLDLLTTIKAFQKNDQSDSKPGLTLYVDENTTNLWLDFWGKEVKEGILGGWVIDLCTYVRTVKPTLAPLVPNQAQAAFGNLSPAVGVSPMFLHVTQTKFLKADGNGLAERVIQATGDTKEFGAGFYTMSPDSLASGDCDLVGTNWFGGSEKTWSVVGFQIPKMPNFWGTFLDDAAGSDVTDLVYYLTTSRGHLRGGNSPSNLDVAAIERINLRGKVLIFPSDDSSVTVALGKKMKASEVSNKQGANLPGNPWVVIGPQRPDFMNLARQVVWREGLGLWLINSAVRAHVYRDR